MKKLQYPGVRILLGAALATGASAADEVAEAAGYGEVLREILA